MGIEMAQIVFWVSVALVAYVYAGYPLLIALAARLRRRIASPNFQSLRESDEPYVTVIIPAHNEERWIERKIENTLALDYPRQRMQILVVSDGSMDKTVQIAGRFASEGVEVAHFAERGGKTVALNRAVGQARGEILVFTDANALLDPDALRYLIPHFSDPKTGGVSGNRTCTVTNSSSSEGEGMYWHYEAWVKSSESAYYSCLGAVGQLFAVRRQLFPHVPAVSDDFSIPMKILIYSGYRIAFEPRALAHIPSAITLRQELERKIRSHVALLFDVSHLARGLNPFRSRVWWEFWSHHVFRLFVPFAMLAVLAVSPWIWHQGMFYRVLLLGEAAFYLLAIIGMVFALLGRTRTPFYPFFYFVFSNAAIAVSWMRRLRGSDAHAWKRTDRALPTIPSARNSQAQD